MEKNLKKNYISALKNNLLITHYLNNQVGTINKQLKLLIESNELRYEERIQYGGNLNQNEELNNNLDSKISSLSEKVKKIKQKAIEIQEKTNKNLKKTIKSISSFNKLNKEVDDMLGDDNKIEEVLSQIDINKILNLTKTSSSNLLLESGETKEKKNKDVLTARYYLINDLIKMFILKSKNFDDYIPENLYDEKYKNKFTILTKELNEERIKNINNLYMILDSKKEDLIKLIDKKTFENIFRLINDEKNNNIIVEYSDLELIMKLDLGINNIYDKNPELFDKLKKLIITKKI